MNDVHDIGGVVAFQPGAASLTEAVVLFEMGLSEEEGSQVEELVLDEKDLVEQ